MTTDSMTSKESERGGPMSGGAGHVPDHVLVAISAVRNGWPVLALRPGTKKPVHPAGSAPNHREFWLTDESAVQRAFEETADPYSGAVGCQFGLMTGQRVGDDGGPVVVAFDVDGAWGALGVLLDQAGPDARTWYERTTWSQRTEGRAHVVGVVGQGQAPPTRPLTPRGAPALEWRGDGGYIVLPGGRNPSGERYRLTRGPKPDHDGRAGLYVRLDEDGEPVFAHPLPVPPSLLALVSGPEAVGRVGSEQPPRAVAAVEAFDLVVAALRGAGRVARANATQALARCPAHDDREASLSVSRRDDRALVYCHAGCSTQAVVGALGLRMADLFNVDDRTTGLSVEVEDTVVDLPGLVDHDGGPVSITLTAGEIADQVRKDTLRDISAEMRARARQRPFAQQWYGRTGAEFDPQKPEPEPCVLRYALDPAAPLDRSRGRFVFSPGFHIVFGPRAVLKTWLAAEALLQKAREGAVSLFIDYEDTYDDFYRRLHVLGATPEERDRVVYVRPPGPLTDDGREELMRRFHDLRQDPVVAVIDSLGQGVAAYGLDDNASGGNGVGTFIEDIPMWLKHQWPFLVQVGIDHLPKGVNPETATDPLGSGRKGFAADGLWSVAALGAKPSREHHGQVRLTCRKDRRGWYSEEQAVLDATFGGGGPLVLAEADPNVRGLDLSKAGESDFTAEELPDAVTIARYVVGSPGVTVEKARNDLGIQAKVFGDLKDKMVTNDVLVHPSRKGLSPGPGLKPFLTFASLFGLDPDVNG